MAPPPKQRVSARACGRWCGPLALLPGVSGGRDDGGHRDGGEVGEDGEEGGLGEGHVEGGGEEGGEPRGDRRRSSSR